MAHLKNLPENATLIDVFKAYPKLDKLANALAQEILRGDGELTPAQRETLFAYGSGLNACHFCHGSHTAVAEAMGVDGDMIRGAVADLEAAPVDEPMRALMRYVKKLTETPSRMTDADADAVRAAGWSDDALHEAITVCALNNFFNRWVDGTGADAPDDWLVGAGEALANGNYTDATLIAG